MAAHLDAICHRCKASRYRPRSSIALEWATLTLTNTFIARTFGRACSKGRAAQVAGWRCHSGHRWENPYERIACSANPEFLSSRGDAQAAHHAAAKED